MFCENRFSRGAFLAFLVFGRRFWSQPDATSSDNRHAAVARGRHAIITRCRPCAALACTTAIAQATKASSLTPPMLRYRFLEGQLGMAAYVRLPLRFDGGSRSRSEYTSRIRVAELMAHGWSGSLNIKTKRQSATTQQETSKPTKRQQQIASSCHSFVKRPYWLACLLLLHWLTCLLLRR